jgi:hypothetical protein
LPGFERELPDFGGFELPFFDFGPFDFDLGPGTQPGRQTAGVGERGAVEGPNPGGKQRGSVNAAL